MECKCMYKIGDKVWYSAPTGHVPVLVLGCIDEVTYNIVDPKYPNSPFAAPVALLSKKIQSKETKTFWMAQDVKGGWSFYESENMWRHDIEEYDLKSRGNVTIDFPVELEATFDE